MDVMLETEQHLQAIGQCRMKPTLISWLEKGAVEKWHKGLFGERREPGQNSTTQKFNFGMESLNRRDLESCNNCWVMRDSVLWATASRLRQASRYYTVLPV